MRAHGGILPEGRPSALERALCWLGLHEFRTCACHDHCARCPAYRKRGG